MTNLLYNGNIEKIKENLELKINELPFMIESFQAYVECGLNKKKDGTQLKSLKKAVEIEDVEKEDIIVKCYYSVSDYSGPELSIYPLTKKGFNKLSYRTMSTYDKIRLWCYEDSTQFPEFNIVEDSREYYSGSYSKKYLLSDDMIIYSINKQIEYMEKELDNAKKDLENWDNVIKELEKKCNEMIEISNKLSCAYEVLNKVKESYWGR